MYSLNLTRMTETSSLNCAFCICLINFVQILTPIFYLQIFTPFKIFGNEFKVLNAGHLNSLSLFTP